MAPRTLNVAAVAAITRAMDESEATNSIVTLRDSEPRAGRMRDALATVCSDSVESNTERGPMTEFWGGEPPRTWRVHVVTEVR